MSHEFHRDYVKNYVYDGKLKYDLSHRLIEGDFDCSNLNLTTLEGVPSSITGKFNCKSNNLMSLEFAPLECGELEISDNPIENLLPLNTGKRDYEIFTCHYTRIENLKGLKDVNIRRLRIGNNKYFNSFEGIPFNIKPSDLDVTTDYDYNLMTQLSWYAYYGLNGYTNYWEEMLDHFLKLDKYVSISNIIWPNNLIDDSLQKFINSKLRNLVTSNNKINKYNL